MTYRIVYDMPEPEYRAVDAWSQSAIKKVRISPRHALHERSSKKEPTDAMALGTALHLALFEPERLVDEVRAYDGTRRGKAWDEFTAENAGKIILTRSAHDKLGRMVKALRADACVRQIVSGIEATEASAFDVWSGVKVKGRADALARIGDDACIIDLKKTTDSGIEDPAGTIVNMGYHYQAAMYCELFQRSRFVFVMVSESEPHHIRTVELSSDDLRHAMRDIEQFIDVIRVCTERGEWPGIDGGRVSSLSLPPWAFVTQQEPQKARIS